MNQQKQQDQRKTQERRSLRISMQYRAGGGFVYELERDDAVLDLRVVRTTDGEPDAWRVEARDRHGSEGTTIAGGAGCTRAEALRRAGVAWNERAAADRALPAYEWEEVALLLAAVGAI